MNDNLIKLTGMYENQSRTSGATYYVGYLGAAKVLLLRDKRAGDGEPGWALMVTARPEKKPAETGRQGDVDHRQDGAVAVRQQHQAPAAGTATERARAARADGSLPFDDNLPVDM